MKNIITVIFLLFLTRICYSQAPTLIYDNDERCLVLTLPQKPADEVRIWLYQDGKSMGGVTFKYDTVMVYDLSTKVKGKIKAVVWTKPNKIILTKEFDIP